MAVFGPGLLLRMGRCFIIYSHLFFTLGDGIRVVLMVFVSILGSLSVPGYIVTRLSICASCIYAFVVLDPYCSDGMLFFGSCSIASISVVAWRR